MTDKFTVVAKERKCFGCGKTGHIKRDCMCSFCKESGHNIKDCETLKNIECQNCLQKGHTAKKCTIPLICQFCKKEGHLRNRCRELYYTQCKRCYRYGHVANDAGAMDENAFSCEELPVYSVTDIRASYVCDSCSVNHGSRVIEDIETKARYNLCYSCLKVASINYGIEGWAIDRRIEGKRTVRERY